MTKEQAKQFNELIPADLKSKFKQLISKFNPIPPVAPVAPIAQAPVAPIALQEAPLEDGTVLKYDTPTLAAGSIVTVVGPEGEMPAPAGELKLQDGTVITVVSKDGSSVVESIVPVAAPPVQAAPVIQSQPGSQPSAIAPLLAQMRSEFDVKIKAEQAEKELFKKSLDQTKSEFETLKTNVSEFMHLFSEIMDTPSAKPIEVPKNKTEKTNLEKFINRNNPK